MSPPKKKRGPAKTALQSAKLPMGYHALCFVQRPFGSVFWRIEQCKARIQDRVENERKDK